MEKGAKVKSVYLYFFAEGSPMIKVGFLQTLLFFALIACSTATKQKVNRIPLKPQVSATLQGEGQDKGLKRKVAIARFSNETSYGTSALFGSKGARIGKQAMDILSSRLTATGNFLIVERSDMKAIKAEQKNFKIKSALVGADYLIVGSVSEFGRSTVSEVGIFSRNKRQKAYAKVNVRLVDVSTGEVIFSEEGQGEALSEANTIFGVGTRSGHDHSLNDKALSSAISKLVSNLIENLLDRPWESRIIGRQAPYYIIAGGKSQGIEKGRAL